jgi:polar amino acid transport system substrate-binding protein
MKKILVILIATFFCVGMLTACSPTEDETATEDDGTFVFKHGFDLDYPPYSYRNDDGEIGGFDVELAQAVCEYMDWEYEAVPFNWDAKDAELESGACDCIWSGFTINGREDDYTWSMPYSDNTQVILVAEDSGIETLDDLAGKTVGVQVATSALDLLQDEEGQAELAATFGALNQYDTYTTAFADLQAGAIEAIAIDITAASYYLEDTEGFVILDEDLSTEQYAIGFRLSDTELRDQVNDALEALAADGTVAEIAENYPEIADHLTLGK